MGGTVSAVTGKNGGPTPPNFGQAAANQSASSRNDINSTFGGAHWTRVDGPTAPMREVRRGFAGIGDAMANYQAANQEPRWQLDIGMAEPLQGAADNLMAQIAAGSQNALDPTAMRDSAIDAAYRMQASRLDPRFAQQQSALENQLANEGFSRGDAGWTTAADNFARQRDDAYQQALLGAQSGAGAQAFAQALAANRQAAMQPYEQLGAIQGMGERAGYASLAGAQPSQDLAAAMQQYQGQLQNYGIDQSNKNSLMSGLFGLGGAYLGRPPGAPPATP